MGAVAVNAEGIRPRRWVPRVRGNAAAYASLGVILLVAAVALAAPLLAPRNPNASDLTNTLAGTSAANPLGTDGLGRDVLSRLIYGSRTALLGPLIVVAGSTLLAVPASLWASYRRGVLDALLSRVWDALFGFPTLLFAIAVIATFGVGFWTATIVVMITYVPLMGRVTRAAVLVEREKPYVDACRLQGYSDARVAFRHVLPNIAGVLGAQSALDYGYSLLDLAALTFLGFGVQAPTADWGGMLEDGQNSLAQHAYVEAVAASLVIIVTVLAFNSLGYTISSRWGRGS